MGWNWNKSNPRKSMGHTCINTYINAYINAYMNAYINTFINTCIHTVYIDTSMHTCTYKVHKYLHTYWLSHHHIFVSMAMASWTSNVLTGHLLVFLPWQVTRSICAGVLVFVDLLVTVQDRRMWQKWRSNNDFEQKNGKILLKSWHFLLSLLEVTIIL